MREAGLDRYERDGFMTLAPAIPHEFIAPLRAQCAVATAPARAAAPPGERYAVTIVGDVGVPELQSLFEVLSAPASALLQTEVQASFVLFHAVTCIYDDGRGWHQALVYHHLPYSPNPVGVPLDELEFLLMLDDAVDESMATWFAPGHHVAPMLEHRRLNAAHAQYELIDPDRQLLLSEPVRVPLRAGDAVAYTLGTPHACVCARDEDPPSSVLFMRVGFRVRNG